MRINFVLPRTINKPMGGYRVVYQYAKRLAEDGNDVHIFFLIHDHKFSLKTIIRKIDGLTFHRKKYRYISWFDLRKVRLHFDQTLEDIAAISQGKIIATHWSTARVVCESQCKPKDKFYLIQDYEIFDPFVTKKELENTWKLPLKKIMVSKWLIRKGAELGINPCSMFYVPNFINTSEFPIKRDNCDRNIVSFLWHNNPRKQSQMGIKIVSKLKLKYPKLRFIMFGVNITDFPKNVEIIENANVQQLNYIYRHSIVYFMPSSKEGWGLTGMEAMACGAAVATIDNGGIWEYANENSAVIVRNNKRKLFCAIVKLIEDKKYREKIVKKAYYNVEHFTFNNSYHKFLLAL